MALIFLAPANDCIGRGILYQKASGVIYFYDPFSQLSLCTLLTSNRNQYQALMVIMHALPINALQSVFMAIKINRILTRYSLIKPI